MATAPSPIVRAGEPELLGQSVVVIGGSAGIGLETARRARQEGADVVLTGRRPERLEVAAREVDAQRTVAFDAYDDDAVQSLFEDLPGPVDHVMVTAGAPTYKPPLSRTPEEARDGITDHLVLALGVAQAAIGKVRPGGCLIFMGGTGGRRPQRGMAVFASATVGMQAMISNLALEIAPIRVNLIAAGFVDTPLAASILAGDLDRRREELRSKLPIQRVVGPADVAALAVHLMTNTALTGATYDIDGGQQFIE